jgi:hypothetical protein
LAEAKVRTIRGETSNAEHQLEEWRPATEALIMRQKAAG